MDIRKLQRAIVDGLEDVKAQNIVVFNTEHLSPLFERVIIASGTSNRQTKSLAASVRDAVKSKGFGVMRTEGEDNGEWIIVDCGAAVVHVMQPAIRDYYKRHKEVTGVDADYWGSPLYYTFLQILEQTFEGVGTTDREAITAYLKSHKFKTIIGEVDIRNQKLDKYWTVGQWQDGFFHAVNGVGFYDYKPVKLKTGW